MIHKRHALKKIWRVVTHPAVLLSTGNIPICYEFIEKSTALSGSGVGLLSSFYASAAVLATRIGEEFYNRDQNTPHLTLSFCNIVTSSALFLHTTNHPSTLAIGLSMGFAFWSSANFLKWRETQDDKTASGLMKPQRHWALGDICATGFITPASLFGLAALARTYTEDRRIPSLLTTEKILGAGYATAAYHFYFDAPWVAAGFLLFTAAYLKMEPSIQKRAGVNARQSGFYARHGR